MLSSISVSLSLYSTPSSCGCQSRSVLAGKQTNKQPTKTPPTQQNPRPNNLNCKIRIPEWKTQLMVYQASKSEESSRVGKCNNGFYETLHQNVTSRYRWIMEVSHQNCNMLYTYILVVLSLQPHTNCRFSSDSHNWQKDIMKGWCSTFIARREVCLSSHNHSKK